MSDFLWMTKSKQNKYTFPLDVFLVGSTDQSNNNNNNHRNSQPTIIVNSTTSNNNNNTFSAIDFVNEYRSRVDSLDTLLEELQEFKDYLKEETISIIHREYSSFIEFSSKLNTITVDQVTTSMPSLIQQMKEFENFIHNLIIKCEKELQVKRRATQKEYISKKLLEIYQLVKFNINLKLNNEKNKLNQSTTTTLNEEFDDCIFSSIADHLKTCTITLKQIEGTLLELSEENISSSLLEKQHLVILFEFYEKVDLVLKDVEKLFFNQISSSFLYFMEQATKKKEKEEQVAEEQIELYHVGLLKILDCMESLYLYGKMELIEELINKSIINPLLLNIFTKDCINQCKNNPEQNVKQLIYNTIISKLEMVLNPIIEINSVVGSAENSSHFKRRIMNDYLLSHNHQTYHKDEDENNCGGGDDLSYLSTFIKSYNCIIKSVLQPIISKFHSDQCKFLYEYRNVKTFHTMFLLQKQFMDEFCKQFVPCHEMNLFTHTLQTVIKPKWQTKIYFALVKQQVVKEFETCLTQQQQTNQQSLNQQQQASSIPLLLENSCELKLKTVIDKMVDLVKNTLFNPTTTFLVELTHDFLTLYIQTISRFQKWLLEQFIPQLVAVCNKNISQDGSAPLLLTYSCTLISKLVNLEMEILQSIDDSIFNHIQKRDEIVKLIKQSFQSRITTSSTTELSPVFSSLVDKIKTLLKDKCVNSLSKANYNWTSANAKTTVSPFITDVFKPLSQFKTNEGKSMCEDIVNGILEQVLFDTCNQYKSDCIKIVEDYKKTQQSLDRLRKNKGSTNKTSSIQDQILRDCIKLEEVVKEQVTNIPNMRYSKALEELRLSLISSE